MKHFIISELTIISIYIYIYDLINMELINSSKDSQMIIKRAFEIISKIFVDNYSIFVFI